MKASVSLALKHALAILAYRSGFLRLWIRRKLGRRPLIVMYHRVLESGTDFSQDGIVARPDTFERQLRLLRKMFRIVPLAEACGDGEPFRCAITFDDGWEDNHRLAFPILRRLDLPATLFVTTGYIGTSRLFWPERLAFLLQDLRPGERLEGAAAELSAEISQRLSGLPGSDFRASLDALIESLKEVDESEREDFLDRLAVLRGHGEAPSGPRMLDWDQVRDLHRQGFEIGSHTVNHALLDQIDSVRVAEELERSRDHLAAQLGTAPQSFAYPNGNWNPGVAESVRRAGYARAVTTELPWKPFAGAEARFAIPRKNLCEGSSRGLFGFSTSVFACEAVGFFDWCRA